MTVLVNFYFKNSLVLLPQRDYQVDRVQSTVPLASDVSLFLFLLLLFLQLLVSPSSVEDGFVIRFCS